MWPPLPSTVVCIDRVDERQPASASSRVAGAKLTLPVDWPSTRIWIGQARSAVGFAAVQLAVAGERDHRRLTLALVANEVNAVGM